MIDHLSYSSITTFLDCPEAWRRHYIAKEPTKTSPALIFGSAIHETVETAIVETGQDLLSIWGAKWPAALESKDIYWGVESPGQYFNEGLRILGNETIQTEIAKLKPAMVLGKYPAIEQKVELRVPGVSVPVIGYIDIILEDGTPADIKTSKASWSDAKASDSLQSLFYLAAMNQAGMNINWKFKHLVIVKTKEPKFQTLEHTHTPGELFFLFEVIKNAWSAIEKEAFPLNPGSWKCNPQYCDFYPNCRGKYQA